MTITVPLPTKVSLNKIYGGVHWSTRKRHKDEFREAMWACQPKPYEGTYPVQVTYYFQFKGRKLDSTNCSYMAKLLEDALIEEAVIPDDAPKFVAKTVLVPCQGENEVLIEILPCAT